VTGSGVVERYLRAIAVDHDWDALAACLDEEFTRVGPYGDTYPTKAEYLAFISALMPTLPGYSMQIERVTYDGRRAYAELGETVELDGSPHFTPEVLTFDLTDAGLISRVEIYIQTRPRSTAPTRG
jgi:hypothetical protein